MPSQPLVTSILLLPLCSVGYLAKLWIFIIELKHFFCLMYSLPGIATSCGGRCMVSFEAFKLRISSSFGEQEVQYLANLYKMVYIAFINLVVVAFDVPMHQDIAITE